MLARRVMHTNVLVVHDPVNLSSEPQVLHPGQYAATCEPLTALQMKAMEQIMERNVLSYTCSMVRLYLRMQLI